MREPGATGPIGSVSAASRAQPFARDQAKPFSTGPYLGGYLYVTLGAVTAGSGLTINHGLRVPPRHVEVLAAPLTYPSRVYLLTSTAAAVDVMFESAQPAGTVVWLW